MPEYNEYIASYFVANRWFTTVSSSFLLQHIYIDATKSEAQRARKGSRQRAGLPFALTHQSKTKRGSRLSQSPVYPPIKCTLEDAQFTLLGVHPHPRNLLLRFQSAHPTDKCVRGTWWAQIQLLTHTMVQVYSSADWHERIAMVDKEKRGFYIGMAFDFGEHIMAFLTFDNLFKVTYHRERHEMDAPLHDPYFTFGLTLDVIVKWADSRAHMKRDGLAIHAVRKANKQFLGVGVYTVVELFIKAGLLPIYTEEEVFDSPSRLARLCLAYYVHARQAHTRMGDFLQPFLRERHFLAVKNEDRLAYKGWLKVYGKDRINVPKRWATQQEALVEWFAVAQCSDKGRVRSAEDGFFDVVEPTYLRDGIEKETGLGPVILGRDLWHELGGAPPTDNSLTRYFSRRNIDPYTSPTYLHSSLVTSLRHSLYLPDTEMSTSWKSSWLYNTESKPFWCAFPNLPSNTLPLSSLVEQPVQPAVVMASYEERQGQLFDSIVKYSKSYNVGPLDYCGIARVHLNSISICLNDPTQSEYRSTLLKAGIERRRHLQLGKQKVANPRSLMKSLSLKRKNEKEEEKEGEAAPKRRRLSADKRIALSLALLPIT